jgi:hypothetical protein
VDTKHQNTSHHTVLRILLFSTSLGPPRKNIAIHLCSKMKSVITLTLGLVGAAALPMAARSSAWFNMSPRSSFARRAEADSILASRSISDPASFASSSYDYIIVGAGTAGLALATRLSDNGRYTIGVLEAGVSGLGASIIDIPGEYGADIGSIYDCELIATVKRR